MTPCTEPDNASEITEFADSLRKAGRPCVAIPEKGQIWVPGVQHELMRLPLDCLSPVDKAALRAVHAQSGIKIASYMLPDSPPYRANCFDYVCRDREYDVSKLTKYGRRDVRRGLRNFEVRPCRIEEITTRGFAAYSDTEDRHGHALPTADDLTQYCEPDAACRFVRYWGAWDAGGELAAWVRLLAVDDWAFITTACSCNDALNNCPNNALSYEVTRTVLVEEKRSVISYGISSLQATSNILSLHRFKLRMGYEATPKQRTFVVPALFKPLLGWKALSVMWDLAARARPHSATLSKVAGLSRLLSGRLDDPLAWAKSNES